MGFQALAGRIPGERIATTVATADAGSITTTEVAIMSVVASLVSGRTYRVKASVTIGATTTDSRADVFIRAGASQIQHRLVPLPISGNEGNLVNIEAEFTASTSGDQEFNLGVVRESGTATLSLEAFPTRPSYLYVDYIRG